VGSCSGAALLFISSRHFWGHAMAPRRKHSLWTKGASVALALCRVLVFFLVRRLLALRRANILNQTEFRERGAPFARDFRSHPGWARIGRGTPIVARTRPGSRQIPRAVSDQKSLDDGNNKTFKRFGEQAEFRTKVIISPSSAFCLLKDQYVPAAGSRCPQGKAAQKPRLCAAGKHKET